MKVAPRSLLEPKKITLPSGLEITVEGSPNVTKMLRMGKLPIPIVTAFQEVGERLTESGGDSADLSPADLQTAAEFQEALCIAVVREVHYVDTDGTIYNMPLVLDAKTDDEFPYEALSQEDQDTLYVYAQEGMNGIATFPEEPKSDGTSVASEALPSKTKRTPKPKS